MAADRRPLMDVTTALTLLLVLVLRRVVGAEGTNEDIRMEVLAETGDRVVSHVAWGILVSTRARLCLFLDAVSRHRRLCRIAWLVGLWDLLFLGVAPSLVLVLIIGTRAFMVGRMRVDGLFLESTSIDVLVAVILAVAVSLA